MNDMTGSGRPQQDDDQLRHTLTVSDVSAQLAAAGVPRSERQIKRYCQTQFLEAKKIHGPTGEQWFIAPFAVPKLIGDLMQWQVQSRGHVMAQPATTSFVTPEIAPTNETDVAGQGRPQPAASGAQDKEVLTVSRPDVTGYVSQLEKRIEEKDDVIGLLKGQLVTKDGQLSELSARFTSLSDRFADTQKLVGAMQRMIAPLLGQSDPYDAPDKREAQPVDNPAASH